jgi:transcription elongation factor SPT5
MVPINEMTDVLKIRRKQANLSKGAWVRFRRGKYAGDIAEIMEVDESGEYAVVKIIPRLDLSNVGSTANRMSRPKSESLGGLAKNRPSQKLFNKDEIVAISGTRSVSVRGKNLFLYNGDYYRNGFLEKEVKLSMFITEDVNPTLDEITKFANAVEDDHARGIYIYYIL